MMSKMRNKKAQEEMIGFGLILVIVAVIILVFISLTLTKRPEQEIESYEIESFLQAMLQHTTECEDYLEYLSVQKLILECSRKGRCLNEKEACEVLNESIKGIISNAWETEEHIGYEFSIKEKEGVLLELIEGNKTTGYKVANQRFSRLGEVIEINFKVYF